MTQTERYVRNIIKTVLTMGPLPSQRPFGVDTEVEGMTVYASPYWCAAIPANGYKLTHTDEATLHGIAARLSMARALPEVKDTRRREMVWHKGQDREVMIFACEAFEIRVLSENFKPFAGVACRFFAADAESMMLIDGDVLGIPDGYAIGAVMPFVRRG